MHLFEQRLAALPAVRCAAGVWRAAGSALTGRRVLLETQDPLDLAKFGIGVLEHGSAAHEDVNPDSVTDRHLVNKAAEIPLQLGHQCI
jgi:hypothetical protein